MHFTRLSVVPPYVFAVVEKEKAAVRATGADVIDFGLGNPDHGTPGPIIDALVDAARIPANHRYTLSKGVLPLRQAISRWYDRRYGVSIDPETEAVVTLGVKEGIAHLMLVAAGPGDVVLVPSPSYPIHVYAPLIAGATNAVYEIGPGRDHLRDIATRWEATQPRPKIVLTCFPHNPTSATASPEFYRELVAWAKSKDVMLVNDNAYADMVFEGDGRAPSLLSVPGAKERAVEFFSMSKSYNMPGWRVGFCVGNKEIVGALAHMKTYMDYGHSAAVQAAAVHALDHGDQFTHEIRELYRDRARVLTEGLNGAGWKIDAPRGTMFMWAPIPEKYRSMGSFKFASKLLNEAHVAVSPGAGFGIEGDGFVRFALLVDPPEAKKACDRIAKFLQS